MAQTSPTGRGWPFLVAAGRRRDFTAVLAPAFLVTDLDYGVLPEVIGPATPGDPPRVSHLRTRHGRRLTLVSTTRVLAPGDLTDPLQRAGGVRDEHGRPLRLVYGFAYPDTVDVQPARADLDAAREPALAAYGRFLADEEGFSVVASQPFPLRSTLTPRPAPRVRGLDDGSASTAGPGSVGGRGSVGGTGRMGGPARAGAPAAAAAARRGAGGAAPRNPARGRAPLVLGAAAALVAALLLVALLTARRPAASPPYCAGASASGSRPAVAGPSRPGFTAPSRPGTIAPTRVAAPGGSGSVAVPGRVGTAARPTSPVPAPTSSPTCRPAPPSRR
jgi:hypothetical protein